jgi:hypothetical protein
MNLEGIDPVLLEIVQQNSCEEADKRRWKPDGINCVVDEIQTRDLPSRKISPKDWPARIKRILQLLCNDRDMGGYTRPVSGQRLSKHVSAETVSIRK